MQRSQSAPHASGYAAQRERAAAGWGAAGSHYAQGQLAKWVEIGMARCKGCGCEGPEGPHGGFTRAVCC